VARTVRALVEDSRRTIENLSVADTAAELATGLPLLVDVREPCELTSHGMIRGAICAPRGMLEFCADPTSPYHREEFDPGRRTILYSDSGSRSALATTTLLGLGYSDVAHLGGGLRAWKKAGLAVTRTQSSVESTDDSRALRQHDRERQ